ncbi:MAG: 6-carboxytetrahydropterin synthase [Candidatus Kapabacteria bacterium]|nr:6-carboxytetrahydropterin synthase [Candidatus Kapabacteria bacterium]
MMFVTKRSEFSAAHRLNNPDFTPEKNIEVYDKCNNKYGHGHNYFLEVTVAGEVNPETGYLIDMRNLKRIVNTEIIEKVDHKNLNYEVDFLQRTNPTMENLIKIFWDLLVDKITEGRLYNIRLYENETSWVDYTGL